MSPDQSPNSLPFHSAPLPLRASVPSWFQFLLQAVRFSTLRFTVLLSIVCGLSSPAFAQTNVFPSTGNVGIGTVSPGTKVEVVDGGGSYQIGTNSSYWSGFKTTAPAGIWGFQQNERAFFGLGGDIYNRGFSPNSICIFNGSPTAEDILLFNQNNPAAGFLVLKASGNVGIGTANPSKTLSVVGGLLAGPLTVGSSAIHLRGTGTGLAFNRDADTGSIYNPNAHGYQWQRTESTMAGSDNLALQVYSPDGSNVTASALAINGSGNVGIGTTSPTHKVTIDSGTNSNTFRAYTAGDFIFALAGDGFTGTNVDLFSIRNANTGVVHLNAVNGARMALGVSTGAYAGSTAESLTLTAAGNVGVGTTAPTHKLSVNGTVRAKEMIVDTGWADYVFKPDYQLASLSEVEGAIKRDGHLPGIPSAAEVEQGGVSLGEMQAKLLAKVEELTLHVIAQEKRLNAQSKRIHALEAENTQLQSH